MTREQEQFLTVVDRDEAERRFRAAVSFTPLGVEQVPLEWALGRVVAADLASPVDVPGFDRSNVDGFAVRAADLLGAAEERPVTLTLLSGSLAPGETPREEVQPGTALTVATGAMIPRGADAVVMVEHAEAEGSDAQLGLVLIRRMAVAGQNISFAGSDLTAGENVVRRGTLLTSRETGVLAAVGLSLVPVWRRPQVAIISTGNELSLPGETLEVGRIYDSNGRILADAVREAGGEPHFAGVIRDDWEALSAAVQTGLAEADLVLLSGGTSKGEGDLCYRVVHGLRDPGVIVHGVALKPGKPICLAVTGGKPVVVLPGFPTSAVFTFHEFVAPLIRAWAGRNSGDLATLSARLAVKVNSEIGRTEYLLVGLTRDSQPSSSPTVDVSLTAWPMGKGSGSVTTFSRADGFVKIDRHAEQLPAGAQVLVQLLGRELKLADFTVIGSHCLGLDLLLGELEAAQVRTKVLAVGSQAGLEAVAQGRCDLAGIHLLDSATGRYNEPFLPPHLTLIRGYTRRQGVAFRTDDSHLADCDNLDRFQAILTQHPNLLLVNRNAGSGTRILIDQLLGSLRPPGYANQPRNHHAVAVAIHQQRADWGVCIEHVARSAGLAFIPLADEQYDFAVPTARLSQPIMRQFQELLDQPPVIARLAALGCYRSRPATNQGAG